MTDLGKGRTVTLAEVDRRVREIEGIVGAGPAPDLEAAHSLEDALYHDLIKAIAEDACPRPRECCVSAAMTQRLTFTRWTA